MNDVLERLRGWCTDWNGAPMVRGEPPRDGLHCDVLFDAADEIERLLAALNEIVEVDHYPDATIARRALGMPVTERDDEQRTQRTED